MANISGLLNNIKSAESGETVRDAIIQALEKINNDNPTQTKPLNVTANGTYTSETGFAYNPVTVNVPAGGTSGYSFEELKVTENGEYEPDDENTMYNKVTVEVPQFANELAPDGFRIEQNGEYDPLLDGYDGYGKIIVAVNEATGAGPFTVEYYNSAGALVHTEQVPKNGNGTWHGLDGTTDASGQYFKSWNPNPVNVTRDLKCYAQYGEYIIDPGEIQDSWEQICAVKGAGYAIGQYKTLYFLLPAYQASVEASRLTLPSMTFKGKEMWPVGPGNVETDFVMADTTVVAQMVKVAEGEGGTTSTWICKNSISPVNYPSDRNRMHAGAHAGTWWDYTIRGSSEHQCDSTDWANSTLRLMLNNYWINYMPECLKATIKPVDKAYRGRIDYSVRTAGLIFKSSTDRIWIPSSKELKTFLEDIAIVPGTNFDPLSSCYEPTGIDYTENWQTLDLFSDDIVRTLGSYVTDLRTMNTVGLSAGMAPAVMQLQGSNEENKLNLTWSRMNDRMIFGFCL